MTQRLGAHLPAWLRRLGARLPPVERLAWIVWALATAGITVRVLVHGDAHRGVFDVFARAAEEWVSGLDTYEPAARYRYPPIATVAFVAFRTAGERLGCLLWIWCNIACYLGAVAWALRAGFPAPLSPRARGAALLWMVLPSLSTFSNAQANGIVAGGLIGAAVALQAGRHRLAALLAVPPVAFKVYPVAFAMVAAAVWPRRFLPAFALGIAACAALPFLCQDPAYVADQYRALWALLRVEDRTGDPDDAYRDLRLVLFHVGLPIGNTIYLALQVAAGAGIAALCVMGRRRGWSARRVAAYMLALVTCWMLVLGFSTEKTTYILATPVLCWLLARADARGERRWFWFWLTIYALYLLPIFAWRWRRGPVARSVLPAATIGLMAAVAWRGVADLARRGARGRTGATAAARPGAGG